MERLTAASPTGGGVSAVAPPAVVIADVTAIHTGMKRRCTRGGCRASTLEVRRRLVRENAAITTRNAAIAPFIVT